MLNAIRQFFSPPVFADEEQTRAGRLLHTVLMAFVIAGLAMAAVTLAAIQYLPNKELFLTSSAVLTVMGLGGIFFYRRGYLRAVSVAMLLTLVGLVTGILCLADGIRNPTITGYVLIIIIAGLLLSGRAAIIFAVISLVSVAGVYYAADVARWIDPPENPVFFGDLVVDATVFGLSALMLYLASRSISRALETSQHNARAQAKANLAIEANRASLEASRRDLALAAEVGQRIATMRDLDKLLFEAVELIRARFEMHYTQVYLADPSGRALVLRAGTGPVGAELLRRRHRLAIGAGSINGTAASEKRTLLVSDTKKSSIFRPNPLLPDIRSEMSVPLIVGDRVVGVLDLQSARPGALAEENLPAFEALAGQLAIAIENAALFADAENAHATMEAQARRLTRTAWEDFLSTVGRNEQLGFTYDRTTMAPLSEPLPPAGELSLAVPLVVSGELVGRLQLEGEAAQQWDEDHSELTFTVARQVAQQIENLRLLAEAQRYRAEAEEAVQRITHAGWESQIVPVAGYAYDQNQVVPLAPDAPAIDATVIQPLIVKGENIGMLEITPAETTETEVNTLVAAVADRLSAHLDNLRLFEQTQKRAAELALVAQVSTATSTILDVNQLLQSVVDVTKSAFQLYHAHLYLLDVTGTQLRLVVGAGDVGKQMVAQEWSIPVGRERSLVARTHRESKGVIVNDVRAAPDFMPNPLLPNTRSEMAVPLIAGEVALGVFDVQSDIVGRFTEEDVRIYTTLAAQVAIALQNANLYAEQAATVTRLRELDHLKNTFLANMSHELRTPLNSILGFADVLLEELDGPLTDRMTNDLEIIKKNGTHLLNLINDILDMAKIEAGKMTLNPERFDLLEVLEEVMDLMGALAHNKGLELLLQTEGQRRLIVEADRVRLRQVLINLMGNAIKFTEQGHVALRTVQQPDHIRIEVQDTGLGIPPDKSKVVFEAFQQVDNSTTRKVGGTGLGLPISRQLIELHGGKLWAESSGVPGEGSTLVITLPWQQKAI